MKDKILFYSLFVIGFVSIFLPFDRITIIGCGVGVSSVDYYSKSLIEVYIENLTIKKIDFVNVLSILFSTLIMLFITIPAILFFYKKHLALIIANVLSLSFFLFLGFSRNFDNDLQFGYYILILQQIILLLLIKVKNRH